MLPSGPKTGPSSRVAGVSFIIATALKVTPHQKSTYTRAWQCMENIWVKDLLALWIYVLHQMSSIRGLWLFHVRIEIHYYVWNRLGEEVFKCVIHTVQGSLFDNKTFCPSKAFFSSMKLINVCNSWRRLYWGWNVLLSKNKQLLPRVLRLNSSPGLFYCMSLYVYT